MYKKSNFLGLTLDKSNMPDYHEAPREQWFIRPSIYDPDRIEYDKIIDEDWFIINLSGNPVSTVDYTAYENPVSEDEFPTDIGIAARAALEPYIIKESKPINPTVIVVGAVVGVGVLYYLTKKK